jgi:peptidoglycan/xylan/chitin deacetylase (PgdA/CDA1 family)
MPSPVVLTARIGDRARHTVFAFRNAVAGVHRRVAEGTVALSFDDGPHPAWTSRVLDTLGELDVKATFFCVGRNAQRHPDLVQRALAEGHVIGSHSFTHPHPAETGLVRLAQEYRDGRQAVAWSAGRDTGLFRPPHGHLSHSSAAMVRRQRLQPWLWTVDPRDWRPGVTSDDVASVAAAAGSRDVILLHDWVEEPWGPEALDRSATVAALPEIVRTIKGRGLRFTTLPA